MLGLAQPATDLTAGAAAAGSALPGRAPFPVFGATTITSPWRPVRRPAEAADGRGAEPDARAEAVGAAEAAPPADRVDGRDPAAAPDAGAGGAEAGTTVDHLTETYRAHYRSLLGLAALLLDDTASCEDVVQEAFIRVHSARRRVRDPEKTLAYLRQTVVNLSRSTLRRRIMGMKLLNRTLPDVASAEEHVYLTLERDALVRALRGLQRRQREVIVLRYFADMTEAQVAEVLGVSVGSVKAYGSRGIAALRTTMEAER